MPYIIPDRRNSIVEHIYEEDSFATVTHSVGKHCENGGDLNYAITEIISAYMHKHGLRYQNISDVVGALEGAKQEFFRKVVNPYEKIKEQENGTIYEVD